MSTNKSITSGKKSGKENPRETTYNKIIKDAYGPQVDDIVKEMWANATLGDKQGITSTIREIIAKSGDPKVLEKLVEKVANGDGGLDRLDPSSTIWLYQCAQECLKTINTNNKNNKQSSKYSFNTIEGEKTGNVYDHDEIIEKAVIAVKLHLTEYVGPLAGPLDLITLEGPARAVGVAEYYILKGPKGEIYPVRKADFEKIYLSLSQPEHMKQLLDYLTTLIKSCAQAKEKGNQEILAFIDEQIKQKRLKMKILKQYLENNTATDSINVINFKEHMEKAQIVKSTLKYLKAYIIKGQENLISIYQCLKNVQNKVGMEAGKEILKKVKDELPELKTITKRKEEISLVEKIINLIDENGTLKGMVKDETLNQWFGPDELFNKRRGYAIKKAMVSAVPANQVADEPLIVYTNYGKVVAKGEDRLMFSSGEVYVCEGEVYKKTYVDATQTDEILDGMTTIIMKMAELQKKPINKILLSLEDWLEI